MPSIMEVHALPAPPPGGLTGSLPAAQLPDTDGDSKAEENTTESPPTPAPPAVVATHTRTIGMIHPPPDIRGIVDKTAQFVARNGPEFERRILANGRNNVKFNFLNPGDPYHAYYQHRVAEMKSQLHTSSQGTAQAAGATPPSGGGPTGDGSGAAQPIKESTDAVKFEIPKPITKVIEPPEPEQYTVVLPEGITGTELDIIKLTAQFVARNGKAFLHGLTHREVSNQTFAFLKPTHSMFTCFTSLCDAYSRVLMPPKSIVEKLRKSNLDRTAVLERSLHRLEWEKSQERARQKAEDEVENERIQMASIDWHDFVVVETIEFADDEDDELPMPMTLEEVIRRSKALTMEEDEQFAEAGKVVEMEMDEEEVQLVEDSIRATTLEDGKGRADEAAMPPPTDDTEPPMRIVKNWKRPEERLPIDRDASKVVVSPITGELIPINEMAEHMRISLIDPKYKEQKERMIAKLRETTLATDDEISRNIVGLARTRPDIFGTTEEEVSNAVKAEIEKKKEEPKQVIWDGHTSSISRTANQAMAQTLSGDEQAAAASAAVAPLPGPIAPPKLAPPPVRPLPPPPGLALNIPRAPQTSGQPTTVVPPPSVSTLPRPPILPTPPVRPPLPVPIVNRPPPPPMPGAAMGSTPMMQYQNLPPPRPPMYMPQPVPTMPMMPPPPPPQGMPPPPPPEEAPPPPPEEPEPKRQKIDELMLIPEDQFLAQHPGAVRITVAVPLVEGEGNLKGQTLEVTIHSLSETILSLKEKISGEIALPANKQKLSGRGGFFFKDNLSLAHYNVGPGETLTLALRERGGRKR
ncbi:hypothetical protein KP509_02G072200 [Ceratopteris richardii]|uniref:Splicing factor 3A subunit 1 n=1 Tax=Ceratopteris richardii TaxID=49495 RepID=A0A8T2VA87_CERRI|nr:hypothetical protein KP509_02G072200 [Ceratopteris richardii]